VSNDAARENVTSWQRRFFVGVQVLTQVEMLETGSRKHGRAYDIRAQETNGTRPATRCLAWVQALGPTP
jgi:hypothetical protein